MRTLCLLIALLTIPMTTLAGGTSHADPPLSFHRVPDRWTPASRPALVRGPADLSPNVRTLPHGRRVQAPLLAEAPARRQDIRERQGSPGLDQRRTGTASWYCCTRGHPSGYYAAAGPDLRVGGWRGRHVAVRGGNGQTVWVTLIDWCACPDRLIDLYPAAFSRLGPLSRGLLNVKVSW